MIKYGGSLNNEGGVVPTGPIPNFSIGGPLPVTSRANLVVSNGNGEVDLLVTSLNMSNLLWQGDGGSNLWDLTITPNWTNGGSGIPLQFFQQDTVSFDSSTTNIAVVLAGSLAPTSVTITGNSNYIFGSVTNIVGNIIGDTILTKNGNGSLTLTNGNNTFKGGTVINSGILKAGVESGGNQFDLALGTGIVTVNTSGELRFGGNGGATVVNHFITNAIVVNGGTVTAADGAQHLTNSTVTISTSGGTFHTLFSTKNLVLDSPLSGAGNLTISSGTNTAAGQVILNNTNNLISGNVTIATNGNLTLIGFAGLTNVPVIDVQQGGILDVTGKSNLTWAVVPGQTLKGNGIIRGKNIAANSGSTIAPGISGAIGTLIVTNNNSTNFSVVTLGGLTSMDINRGSNPNADLILNAKGTNNFGGTLTVNNLGAALQANDSFQLFNSQTNLGTFSTINLPALSAGLSWSNSLAVNGKITVVTVSSIIPPTVSPTITNFSLLSGTNIILNGTNAQSGATYYLLTTTNLPMPVSQWKTIATNLGAGNTFSFTATNAVGSPNGRQFYILSSTNYNP